MSGCSDVHVKEAIRILSVVEKQENFMGNCNPQEQEVPMIYQILAIVIVFIFYSFYFAKLLIQKKQGIKTNQMGTGKKRKKVLWIERMTSCATMLACVADVYSIFLQKNVLAPQLRIVGIIMGFMGVIFFALATITMKTSWRVGIPEEKTKLVTEGIYQWSRNPAFVGFDLLYISVCFMFFTIPLMIISLWAMVMLHLQILQEENHMHAMFGEEYDAYRIRTLRYIGRRR